MTNAPATWGLALGASDQGVFPTLLSAGSVALLTVLLHALFRPPLALRAMQIDLICALAISPSLALPV